MDILAVLRWRIRTELFTIRMIQKVPNTIDLVDFAICDVTLPSYGFS
jgi:hypothetical protein